MNKYAAWIEGYCEALLKLGVFDPKRVMQIKQMLAKEVPAAHAKNVARATEGVRGAMATRPTSALPSAMAGSTGSTRMHPLTGQPMHSRVEQDVLKNLGYSRGQAYMPPKVPAAARRSETGSSLRAAGF